MPFSRFGLLICCIFIVSGCGPELPPAVELAYAGLPETVDFNQHVRPILSDRCWSCHGPDAASRQAGLRLDNEVDAFATLASGHTAFAPGSVSNSEAIRRMLSDDPEVVMPTPESKLTLEPREIALIVKWVEQGAEWKDHWAWLPIAAPAVPDNPPGMRAYTPVDNFLNAELHRQGRTPNERADDERLLRRLYLDLTGLPPSPAQMDAWLRNPDDEAYTGLVDQLLATPAAAERLAMEWMDVARYADSHGMHADGERLSYPYRDWVIRAFAENKPYDDFLREQIAGDLLPDADQNTRVASAFNRMHPMTAEGGVIDEEMRLNYVFDRVNTVATGVLGLTMDCSRCHDHKFDPLSQAEYYGFSAFFNNFRELGMTGDDGDFGPYILLADHATQSAIDAYGESVQAGVADMERIIDGAELKAFADGLVARPQPDVRLAGNRIAPSKKGPLVDGGVATATKELSVVDDPERGACLEFDHPYDDAYFRAGVGDFRAHEPFSASLWVRTVKRDTALTQTLIGTAGYKNNDYQGSDFYLDGENRLNVRLVKATPDDLIHVRTRDSVRLRAWTHVAFTYDGTGAARGLRLYIDGRETDRLVLSDQLRGRIYPAERAHETYRAFPVRRLRIGQSYRTYTGEDGIFLGRLDDIHLWNAALTPAEVVLDHSPAARLADNYVAHHLAIRSDDYRTKLREVREAKREQLARQDTLPRLMVSQDMPTPRPTYVLARGAYDAPTERVEPGTPARILPFPEDLPKNRLGLTEWLFHPDNPLTARVAVNRYWQMIFGRGLVKTAHDFGSQGALPSHPELLDYLATDFRNNGWDLRRLLRTMVLSDAYRRASHATPDQREWDPENVFLARGPSGRLPAEMIRDNALAAAGLLNRDVGGPSVRPYQPEGLWIQANQFSQALLRYVPDAGDDLYRRSLYTFNKRTAPPPFMVNFDAAGRDVCTVKRSQTNTPLQALNLLNDPQFVEAARVLAQRVQTEKQATGEQLSLAFRLVTGRRAKTEEITILERLYADELARFRATPALADSLLTTGEFPLDPALDPLATAALASVGNVLLNHDEAYVKR